ncbi:MAG: hypothetical protein K2M94_06335 [Paramuribaculum sp.]|nr:hypothetical protein [Paramuribaculum sp.]
MQRITYRKNYGISGGGKTKDGKSKRAESQVNKWNKEERTSKYESQIVDEVPAGTGARDKALYKERELSDKYLNDLDPEKHKRPRPNRKFR